MQAKRQADQAHHQATLRRPPVVAAPEPDALREASYFVERFAEERMPLAGLVVNRVHESATDTLSAARSRPPPKRWRSAASTR
jgi:anion-transporting  ArsA/GET3 family ATPase